jgi:hypothetical protein
MVIDRLVHLLPREYQGVLPARAGQGSGDRRKMLKKVKRIRLKPYLPAVDEGGAGARRMAAPEVRVARNPSGNLGLSTDSSRGVIRVVVCALHPLRPSWLGASEESAPND